MKKRKNKRTELQNILNRYKNINMPELYRNLMADYIRFIYKWIDPINHALDDRLRVEALNQKANAAYMKKLTKYNDHVQQLCWIRDTAVVLLSYIVFIGIHVPNKESIKNFYQLKDIIEGALIDRMVVICRYKRSFLNGEKFSLKGTKKPMDCLEIQRSKHWPEQAINAAAFVNGQTIMGLRAYIKENK